MKQYENIKQMDKEELANFLCDLMCVDCCENRCPARKFCSSRHIGMKDWLESEVNNEQRETTD